MTTNSVKKTIILTGLTYLLLFSVSVNASYVPVFRYALEGWSADNYDVVIFHRGTLTSEDMSILEWFEKTSVKHIHYSNYTIKTVDVTSDESNELLKLWKSLGTDELPSLILRYPVSTGIKHRIWHGPLSYETAKILIDSPARQEIAERILEGDSAVWILLESGHRSEDNEAADILETQLKKMEGTLKLPKQFLEAIYSNSGKTHIPELQISFSMIRLSHTDLTEFHFINMLIGGEPDFLDSISSPVAIPVYGRGRALYPLIGDDINERNIHEVCVFLTGACSYEVKAFNPGFDLLMMVDWDSGIQTNWTDELESPRFVGQSELDEDTDERFSDEKSNTLLPADVQNESDSMSGTSERPSRNLSESGEGESYSNLIRYIMIFICVIFLSLTMLGIKLILSKQGEQCRWCGKAGIFLSINSDGLCKKCEPLVRKDVYSNGKIIQDAEKLLENSVDDNIAIKQYRLILNKAKEILKYEQKGIPTYSTLPSEIIKKYVSKHDKLIMESMPKKVNDALKISQSALMPLKSIIMVNRAIQNIIGAKELLKDLPWSMRILSFINQKGGVGKTTSTLNVGAGLAKLKKKVLLIDFDPQANLTDGMGIDEENLKFSIYDLIKSEAKLKNVMLNKNGLSILPSQILLTRVENEFGNLPRRNFMLKDALKGLKGFDYVLIDCPPSLGFLTLNALAASKEVYIPLQPEYFALKGIRKLLDIVKYVKKEGNEELTIKGIIGTRFDSRKIHHREVIEKIQESLGNKFYYIIRENISLAEASSYGQSIFEYKPSSHGAEDYMELCKEILKRDSGHTL